MSARRATEVSNRRTEILAAAAELFATKGFGGTTVRDIADSVGILSGSLYHHFNAKEDMVEEIFTAYFDELAEQWDEILAQPTDSVAKFEDMLRAAFGNVDRHTAAARLFTHEWLDLRHLGDFAQRWEEIESMWLRVIHDGIAEGEFRSDIEDTLLFSVAMDLIRGLSGWYHRGGRYSIEALTDAYIGVMMTGIVAPAPGSTPVRAIAPVTVAAAERPVAEPAAKSVVKPATRKPAAAKKPAAKKPVAKKATAKKAGARATATKKPAAKKATRKAVAPQS